MPRLDASREPDGQVPGPDTPVKGETAYLEKGLASHTRKHCGRGGWGSSSL